jgi:hypothetical protein
MRVTRVDAPQAHPVPKQVLEPQGPFPRELFNEKPIVDDYVPESSEDGSNFPVGATAQNNYTAPRTMICKVCDARVLENKTGDHVCE